MGEMYRYRDLIADGLSRETIRHGRRVCHGVYGDGELLQAMFLRLPANAVLGFRSAAALYGFAEPPAAIEVIIPAGTPAPLIRGVRAHEAVLAVEDVRMMAGVPCAPPARCAVDLARTARRMAALPMLDAALRSAACTADDLAAEVVCHAGLRGVVQARELVRLADGRAECAQESQLRLVLIDGGLPTPEPQIWVHDEYDVPRYRLDMGYRWKRVGVEYDGASHLSRESLPRDRLRLNWLGQRGWTMRYFTATDLYRRPTHVVDTIRAALS